MTIACDKYFDKALRGICKVTLELLHDLALLWQKKNKLCSQSAPFDLRDISRDHLGFAVVSCEPLLGRRTLLIRLLGRRLLGRGLGPAGVRSRCYIGNGRLLSRR